MTRLRIGLSANFLPPDRDRAFYPHSILLYTEAEMAGWVSSLGALAYQVPLVVDQSGVAVADYVADLDGLLLAGGADVSPTSYGEEPLRPQWAGDAARDAYEIELVRAFLGVGKPVLGVCRGCQILNVALGGTLHQDIGTQVATERVHRSQEAYHHNQHEVDLAPDGILAGIHPGTTRARVNSIHHQAVRDPAPGVVVEARSSDDGVVEGISLPGRWAVGVQWHPEFFALTPDDGLLDTQPLLAAFLDEAARVRDGR